MPKDYARTETLDLAIENGDFKTTESTYQHQEDLLLTDLGGLRMFPYMGVGISGFVNDDDFGDLGGRTRETFELDGQIVEELTVFEDATIKTNARYPE
ncbi:hypothetical protein [Reichenbachiella sp.]|uniref:hypothetical protein n=1 Tax=Reichenbachiella sp. TaxID=2184521 RepID=UPI003B59B6F8